MYADSQSRVQMEFGELKGNERPEHTLFSNQQKGEKYAMAVEKYFHGLIKGQSRSS